MDERSIDRDAITGEVTHVRDSGGGTLYRVGALPVVVLNGSYGEMGRQYGDLMKDKLHATRDRWKQIFVDSGALSFESILEAIGRPFYTSSPKTRKDLYTGISETSGLSRDEIVVLDNWLFLVLLGRRAGCSSYVAWGSRTIDGSAYMGRNFDFPKFARDLAADCGHVVVQNPIGGDFSVAGLGLAGTVSGFDDAINSAGLYVEFNNGLGSIEPVTYSNRYDVVTYLSETLARYSTIEELRIVFNTVKANYPLILGVCQPDQGVHFEVSPETYIAEASDEHSLRANEFMSPEWGIPVLPGRAGWYTVPRMEAWHAALAATKADQIDETVLMKAMNAPMFNADGSLTGTGFSVFELVDDPTAGGGGESGDVTLYQVITHPAERKWWVRIPTHTGWCEIDLNTFFTQ